jgi:hypothetical protein
MNITTGSNQDNAGVRIGCAPPMATTFKRDTRTSPFVTERSRYVGCTQRMIFSMKQGASVNGWSHVIMPWHPRGHGYLRHSMRTPAELNVLNTATAQQHSIHHSLTKEGHKYDSITHDPSLKLSTFLTTHDISDGVNDCTPLKVARSRTRSRGRPRCTCSSHAAGALRASFRTHTLCPDSGDLPGMRTWRSTKWFPAAITGTTCRAKMTPLINGSRGVDE